MFQSVRNAMRSWMFIYVGLFAAIIVAANPADTDEARFPDPDVKPIAVDTAISRSDI